MKNEAEERIFITIKTIVAIFASYAIKQSPYKVPANLEKAILRFHLMLEEHYANFLCIEDEWIQGKFKESEWRQALENIILDRHFMEVRDWNQQKNPYHVYQTPGAPKDPDNNFIDIWALARNVAHESWQAAILNEEDNKIDDSLIKEITNG